MKSCDSFMRRWLDHDIFPACFVGIWSAGISLISWRCQPLISRDGASYLLAGVGHCGTFTPYIAQIARWSIGRQMDPEATVVYLNIIAVALASVAVYGIARMCFGKRDLAAAVALIFASNPNVVKSAHMVQREAFFLFGFCMSVFGVFFAYAKSPRSWGRWFALACGGFFCAFALFARVEIMEWWLVANILIMVGVWGDPSWRTRISSTVIFNSSFGVGLVLMAALLAVPLDKQWQFGAYKALFYLKRFCLL